MPRSLYSIYSDPELLLKLKPAELGLLILQECWEPHQKLNRGNFSQGAVRQYPQNFHERIETAAMEAWAWLNRNGLIAEAPEGNGWYFITQEGRTHLRQNEPNQPASSSSVPAQFVRVKSINSSENVSNAEPDPSVGDSSRIEESLAERNETILTSGLSDQAALKDALGFEPYVKAIADFLTDVGTEPPITLSIEGEWGEREVFIYASAERAAFRSGQTRR